MHLLGLTLAQFGALLAISVAAAAALYALKQRRRTVVVSFAPLWAQVTADRRRTSLFERLRQLLSFLLQVAFVFLVLAAIARPRLGGGDERERRFVVVIDCGASMQARLDASAERTRFDEAKSLARELVGHVSADDRVMIVCAGLEPEAVTAFEADRRSLFSALEILHPYDARSDLDEAVRFATRLAGRADRVVVFTDQADVAHQPQEKVAWHRVGKPLDNLAITKFAARPLAESPGEWELFFEVRNFTRAEASARLRIERSGARAATIDDRPLKLAPGGAVSDVLHGLAGEDATLRAHLVDEKGEPLRDGLALDDSAEAAIRAPRVVKVLVVGAADFFLDAALASDPFVAARHVEPKDYAGSGEGDADAVIFDGFAPAQMPPRAVLINAPGAGELRDAFIDRVDESHPVMRWVGRLSDVRIARSRVLAPEPGDVVLASCAGSPVMLAREHNGRRLVEIGFDLKESDLPLRVAFPKLVRNAVRWAATGEAPDAAAIAGIEPRDGTSDLFWCGTPAPGCDFRFSGTEGKHPPEGGWATQATQAGLELAPALAAIALALTLFEWLSYHRRWTV